MYKGDKVQKHSYQVCKSCKTQPKTVYKPRCRANQSAVSKDRLTSVQNPGVAQWVMPHLMRVNLLQIGGVPCQHFDPEPGDWVQIAAGIAVSAKLGQLGQLLQGL